MEYITLNNGVQMPMVGFGTWQIRGEAGERAILEALELGYRLLDTARMYENEETVGRAVRQSGVPRREIFLTTKLFSPSAGYRKAKRTSSARWKRCRPTTSTCCCCTNPMRPRRRCTKR